MKLNQYGVLNVLLIPFIFSIIFLLGAAGFGVWAFMSRQDYKNNTDGKIANAVKIAEKKVSDQKDNEFLEKEKFPLDSYQGPADLGGVFLQYPKTWSAYVSTVNEPFFIFNPRTVSAGENAKYAVKVNVLNSSYKDVAASYEGQMQAGKLKAKAYSLPKLKDVIGLRFDGEIQAQKIGSVVVLPLRDKTITITNEVPDLVKDFDEIILANLTFNP